MTDNHQRFRHKQFCSLKLLRLGSEDTTGWLSVLFFISKYVVLYPTMLKNTNQSFFGSVLRQRSKMFQQLHSKIATSHGFFVGRSSFSDEKPGVGGGNRLPDAPMSCLQVRWSRGCRWIFRNSSFPIFKKLRDDAIAMRSFCGFWDGDFRYEFGLDRFDL